eukprot:scaffold77644_cov67-Phaeocystis_antarctica.AAC.2
MIRAPTWPKGKATKVGLISITYICPERGGRERSRLSVPISRNVSSLDEHRRRRRYLGVGPKAALDDRQGGDL